MTSFSDLGLSESLLRAVAAEGYAEATPIQAATIPHLLQGRDVLGLAQTGTGKTGAFALPILQRLSENPKRSRPRATRVLVLTPTRELALQVGDSFSTLGRGLRLRRAIIHGGVGLRPQIDAVAPGIDIVVATPGRLLDLIKQGCLTLAEVEIFVLDEADRMLDMGFVRDVRRIVAMLPRQRQTLLFSATMPDAVSELAHDLMTDFERVAVTPSATTADRVEQRVLFVDKPNKRALLTELLRDEALSRTIVFARTKHGADTVVRHLQKAGLRAEAIHGNKSQNARVRALDAFKVGQLQALVATDLAARGIDVEGVTHVINFDLPNEPESYVHRIGRTARAGRDGLALSFCDTEEVPYLRAIERTIRQPVPVTAEHPYRSNEVAALYASRLGAARSTVSRQGPGRPQAPGRHGPARPAGRPAQPAGGARQRAR